MSYRINDEYPGDYEAKQGILEVGRRMYAKNFVASNDGNISCKVSDNTVWCTPTGHPIGFTLGDRASGKATLGAAIDNAKAAKRDVAVSADGKDLADGTAYTTEAQKTALEAAIAAAQQVECLPDQRGSFVQPEHGHRQSQGGRRGTRDEPGEGGRE